MVGQLTVLAGAPGSGKSTFVATLEDVSVLTTHQLRAQAQAPDPAFWVRMQRAALRRLEAGEHVVIDACNTRRHSRLRWLRLGVPADLVVLQTRVELCQYAQQDRAHPVPLPVVAKYCRELHRALRAEIPREPWRSVRVISR